MHNPNDRRIGESKTILITKSQLNEMKIILSEATASEIHGKFYPEISDDDFNKIVSADPISSNLERNNLGEYGKWLLNLYKKKNLKLENLYKATEYITIFDKAKKSKKLVNNDINKYKSLPELFSVVEPFTHQESISNNDIANNIKNKEADVVYEDAEWKVIVPKTEKASCLYGANTQWCTASKENNMFDEYNEQGKLYININKQSGRKYQFHLETKSFMDEIDEKIKLNSIGLSKGLIEFYENISPTFKLSCIYDYVGDSYEGFVEVQLNNKWSYIDTKENLIGNGNLWFDIVGEFSKGFAQVKLNGIWLLVDTKGNFYNTFKKLIKQNTSEHKKILITKLQLNEVVKYMDENINIPITTGDTVLMGKFKNKKTFVKSIGKDEWGMPTINGKKAVTFRIPKKIEEDNDNISTDEGGFSHLNEVEISDVDMSSFEIKKELNTKFWTNKKLASKVRRRLLKIADDFLDFINVDSKYCKDILFLGSLSNYNWSKYSDVDLHLVVDFKKINSDVELVREYFDAKRKIWTSEHDALKIYGFPIEIYIQDTEEVNASTNIFSLEKNKWLKIPKEDQEEILDVTKIKQKSADIMTKIDDFKAKYDKKPSANELDSLAKKVKALVDSIKSLRKSGLESKGGEFSVGNIVFKVLRRSGHMETLIDLKVSTYDKINTIK